MARGLTLIETLAVVTLLTLTVSLVTASFSGAVDGARLREATSIVRDVDARARLGARVSGPITLMLNTDRSALLLRSDENIVGPSSPVRLPDHMHLFLLGSDGEVPLDAIRFDRLGRSRDYRVHIELGEHSRSLDVAGLTGWIEEGES